MFHDGDRVRQTRNCSGTIEGKEYSVSNGRIIEQRNDFSTGWWCGWWCNCQSQWILISCPHTLSSHELHVGDTVKVLAGGIDSNLIGKTLSVIRREDKNVWLEGSIGNWREDLGSLERITCPHVLEYKPKKEKPVPYSKDAFKFGIEVECLVPFKHLRDRYYFEKTSIQPDEEHILFNAFRTQKLPFEIGYDISLKSKPQYAGRELRTTGNGLLYKDMQRAITGLGGIRKEYGLTVNKSCGFHVHISHPLFFTKKHLERIILFWSAIEDVLLATQPTRIKHNKCMGQSFLDLPPLPEIQGNAKMSIQQWSKLLDKYRTLNFDALYKHGTLEVRLHAGTVNATKMQYWVDLILAIMEYCLTNYSQRQVKKLLWEDISPKKIRTTLTLLGIQGRMRKHFMRRVQKFTFPYLKKERRIRHRIHLLQKKKENPNLIEKYQKKLKGLSY